MRPNEPLHWVIGTGGLLGSHLAASLGRHGGQVWPCPIRKFSWGHPEALSEQLVAAVTQFSDALCLHQPWCIYWAAGAAVIGSSEETLQAETTTWQLFLELVARHLHPLGKGGANGLFLASSAGGVYGDAKASFLSEESPPSPISAYGWAKLRQEQILQNWSRCRLGVAYLIGRISNLYGPGQNLAKPQGLLSHISRCLIFNQPLHLYVPLDTIRDYLRADDCADQVVRCMTKLSANPPPEGMPRGYVKVLASEQATSLAQVIAVFGRVSRRHPKLICSPS